MGDRERPNEIEVRAHPPERRFRPPVAAACGCSCCCCCLHSLGSLVGAAIGSRSPKVLKAAAAAAPDTPTEDALAARRTGVKLWWLALLGATALCGGPAFAANGAHDVGDVLMVGGGVVLLGLPVLQLAASILALIAIAVAPRAMIPVKSEPLRAIGKLTLWTVLGTVAGCVVMGIILKIATAH